MYLYIIYTLSCVASGRSVSILLISLVVAQLALLSALYVHNLQLSGEVGEFKSKAQTFEGKLKRGI